MVHSIVLQSHGHITARSETGLGTAFEILLPRFAAMQKVGDGEHRQSRAVGADARPTVLLVDDQDNVRRAMHQVFENEGERLLEAGNGEEAETIARKYHEPIHLLVTDVALPGITGPQLADRLAVLRPDIKVLYVSGYPHDFLSGEQGFLPKPFSAAQLLGRARNLLGCGAHANARPAETGLNTSVS